MIHVIDASRSVNIAGQLLNRNQEERNKFFLYNKTIYKELREKRTLNKTQKKYISLEEARKNKFKIDWNKYKTLQPKHLGVQILPSLDLNILKEYIDWTPFFMSWQLHGKYPGILEDQIVGREARKLFADAQVMIEQIILENWLEARAIIGLFPANSNGDDIEIYDPDNHKLICIAHHLRQQRKKAEGRKNNCLADFISPKSKGKSDYIGAFAVSAGFGIENKIREFEQNHDDYQAILLKALADRFAEAAAEYLHECVRKEYWGYAQDEKYSNEELIHEKYQGIRPAPGYPACPDHTEKALLFDLLDVEQNIGISLTESYAMYPAASVSGWYIHHPESRYFGLGNISKDQLEDYAKRKNYSVEEMEKWLAPVLNYK